MIVLHQALLRLEGNGFTVNPTKCAWVAQSTKYLGFLLTTDGIKPLPQKIDAISRIARPTAPTHVRSFVGLIYYYRVMWPRRAHILAPLTDLCGPKNKFKWTGVHEQSFILAKKSISEDVLLRFPNHKLPFEIYTDASSFQLGATIKQKNLPIAYF